MNLKTTINKLEAGALEIMSAVAPWLAPIPSAYLVGKAVTSELGWHISIGIIAAVAVEAVGIVSITNSLRLYEWNQTKRKSDPAAPIWLAYAAVFVYFAVTILLTVLLESFPELNKAVGMYLRNGFVYLTHALGNSGHFACNIWMEKDLTV